MKYVSTRGEAKEASFENILASGTASDGGLFVPSVIPKLESAVIDDMKNLSYTEIAEIVIKPFIGDFLQKDELQKIISDAYKNFETNDVVQIKDYEFGQVLELFHGPTLAFKDVAMQLLGRFLNAASEKLGKKIVILGAGGVVPSIIYALKRMNAHQIYLSNRTKEKAEILKNIFEGIEVFEWGKLPECDMIINATSLGLKKNDKFEINFSKLGKDKFFFDVIYNPFNTEFAEAGNKPGNIFENGLHMFLFQAQKAFSIWHNIEPKIDQEVIKFLQGKN